MNEGYVVTEDSTFCTSDFLGYLIVTVFAHVKSNSNIGPAVVDGFGVTAGNVARLTRLHFERHGVGGLRTNIKM